MGIKNKVQILLFPVTLAAGIITGIAIEKTKKRAAGIAAVDAALKEELPAEEAADTEEPVEETAETEEPVEGTAEKQAEDQAEAGNPEEIS
jgi:hypothetical protein